MWPELEALHGDAPALEAPHQHPPEALSYRQLRQGIEAAATAFAALGVAAGDVVALFAMAKDVPLTAIAATLGVEAPGANGNDKAVAPGNPPAGVAPTSGTEEDVKDLLSQPPGIDGLEDLDVDMCGLIDSTKS